MHFFFIVQVCGCKQAANEDTIYLMLADMENLGKEILFL